MKLTDIVRVWIAEHGYDGLCNEDCGCTLDDFMPCDGWGLQFCIPAYRHPGNGDRPFVMHPYPQGSGDRDELIRELACLPDDIVDWAPSSVVMTLKHYSQWARETRNDEADR
jgi:hypothetical protein